MQLFWESILWDLKLKMPPSVSIKKWNDFQKFIRLGIVRREIFKVKFNTHTPSFATRKNERNVKWWQEGILKSNIKEETFFPNTYFSSCDLGQCFSHHLHLSEIFPYLRDKFIILLISYKTSTLIIQLSYSTLRDLSM